MLKTILVASCRPGEGKSLTVSNLAVSMAMGGKRVAVIDADFSTAHIASVLSTRQFRRTLKRLVWPIRTGSSPETIPVADTSTGRGAAPGSWYSLPARRCPIPAGSWLQDEWPPSFAG